jgi:hypothetical protein
VRFAAVKWDYLYIWCSEERVKHRDVKRDACRGDVRARQIPGVSPPTRKLSQRLVVLLYHWWSLGRKAGFPDK